MTAPRHVDVGAYVLGILDNPDEAAYERHFAQCEECRREFIEMADMPAILDTLKPSKAPAQPPPALPPLSALIDFTKLQPPGPPSMPSMPAVPPQQRPNGATQPHKLPRPSPSPMPPDRPRNGAARPSPAVSHPRTDRQRTNGTARPAPARAEGTGRHTPVAPRAAAKAPSVPAKPPSKPRDSGPAGGPGGRRVRKPLWLTAAAVVAVALTVGMMIGLPSGDSDNQVADKTSAAPTAPPSDAVAGAHIVSGTDPDTGVTAIITIEPVPNGTEIDLTLYEIDGPQEGVLIAVSRFGDRQEIAQWRVPEGGADRGEAVRASGVSEFAQQDINRFEFHGDGIEPLLVVPT